MPDIELQCPECNQPFTFTEDEQTYCTEHAYPPPTFCPACHSLRKAAKVEARGGQRHGGRHGRRR